MPENKNIETIIGLEIHVQLKTKSKMFCGCSNEGVSRPPNTTVCEVCTGQPGTLPSPNLEAVRMAMKIALALGCRVNRKVKFDRKHYFYPDLPKGYQITQYDLPIGENGVVAIPSFRHPGATAGSDRILPGMRENSGDAIASLQHDNNVLNIRITRVHLEEDTAKLMHSSTGTLVDFNRSGTPLVEIVTEPDFRTPQEAKAFLQLLRSMMRVCSVSDADMEKGHLRCDANISVRFAGEETLNPKSEIKNINSFRNVERALAFEEGRLSEMLEKNESFIQETRGWNDGKSRTEPQRTKEEATDYRYLPEPDIPLLFLYTQNTSQNPKSKIQNERKALFDLEEIRKEIPELPQSKWERFKRQYGFSDTYLAQIVEDSFLADYLEETISELTAWLMALPEIEGPSTEVWDQYGQKIVKLVSDWILNRVAEILKSRGETFKDMKVTPENFAEFLSMIYARRISSTLAHTLLEKLIAEGGDPSNILADMGGEQVSEEDELESICSKVLIEAPEETARYRAGKTTLLQFFIGKAMKETKGKGNPEVLKKIFEEKLGA